MTTYEIQTIRYQIALRRWLEKPQDKRRKAEFNAAYTSIWRPVWERKQHSWFPQVFV